MTPTPNCRSLVPFSLGSFARRYALFPVIFAFRRRLHRSGAEAFWFPNFTRTLNNSTTMRAWTCHGRTQQEMVNKLTQAGILKSEAVVDCMSKVDRANYVLHQAGAYDDAPQGIGFGQTISAPHMHAHVLEDILPSLLHVTQDGVDEVSILDVGCGSGYLTACLGRLVDRGTKEKLGSLRGKVYGIDCKPDLVAFAKSNINKADKDLFETDTVHVEVGDGWKGMPSAGPFHAIHVGAAADDFPRNLMVQLAVGGILICPVGPDGGYQNLYKIGKLKESKDFNENNFDIKRLIGVRYVPLVHVTDEL